MESPTKRKLRKSDAWLADRGTNYAGYRWIQLMLHHRILVLLVLIVLSALPANSADLIKSYEIENAAYNTCVEAENLINSGDFTRARDTLRKAEVNDPTTYSATIHHLKAKAYRGLKDIQKALSECDIALKYQPDDDGVLYTKALICHDRQDYEQEVACLERILNRSKESAWAAKAKAMIEEVGVFANLKRASDLVTNKHDAEAIKYLDRAAKFDPSPYSASVHAMLSFSLRRSGNPKRAIEEGKSALKFDSNEKDVVYNLGIAYGDLGNFGEAVRWVNKYLSMETDPSRREEAANCIKTLEVDKQKNDDPSNKQKDYLQHMDCTERKWDKEHLPVKVFISSGQGVFGYRKNFDGFIKRSFDMWVQATDKKIGYKLVKNKEDANIVVVWTAGGLPHTHDHLNVETAGLTRINTCNGTIKDAVVSIRTVDPFDSKRVLDDGECASVCIHEVGHSLGLGHSNCVTDVMYFRSAAVQTGLPTSRDKATMARLYSTYPSLAYVPTPSTEPTPAMPPVKPLPTPVFMPPKPPSTEKIVPPLFIPPPISAKKEIQPPLYMPPPPTQKNNKPPPPPLFIPTPPPSQPKKQADTKPAPPLFTPPPPK